MTTSRNDLATRSVCAVRAAWGLAQIADPGGLLTAGRGRNDRLSRAVLRVLGARHLIQAAAVAAAPTREVQRIGVLVDLLHAASAAALAGIDPRQRRYAATEVLTASAWAASGWILQRATR